MKKSNFLLSLFGALLVNLMSAQATFTNVPTLCVGGSVSLTGSTGTMTAVQYSWGAFPSGPIISNPTGPSTNITFTAAGTYTIGFGFLTMSGFSYTTNTIVIDPVPVLTVSASSASICAGQSLTLTASGAASYTWSPAGSLNTAFGSSVIATPPTAVVYSVTGSIGSCTATMNTPVIVYPSPSNFTIVATHLSACTGFNSTLTAFTGSSYTWTGTGIITPINQQSIAVGPGTYTVHATVGNCGLYTSSITIGVGQQPNIVASASMSNTCIDSNSPMISKPVTLMASGGTSYTWAPPSPGIPNPNLQQITVRPASTTCYTVIGSSAGGCTNTAEVCVTVTPQFTIAVNTATATLCSGESVTLGITAVGLLAVGPPSSFTYSWTESPGAPSLNSYLAGSVTASPLANTSYTVELRDANQCVSLPRVIAHTVNACTGLSHASAGKGFLVFPNPVKTKLTLHSEMTGDYKLWITDLLGNQVYNTSGNFDRQKDLVVDLEKIPAGLYFVRLNQGIGEPLVQKIIKE